MKIKETSKDTRKELESLVRSIKELGNDTEVIPITLNDQIFYVVEANENYFTIVSSASILYSFNDIAVLYEDEQSLVYYYNTSYQPDITDGLAEELIQQALKNKKHPAKIVELFFKAKDEYKYYLKVLV